MDEVCQKYLSHLPFLRYCVVGRSLVTLVVNGYNFEKITLQTESGLPPQPCGLKLEVSIIPYLK